MKFIAERLCILKRSKLRYKKLQVETQTSLDIVCCPCYREVSSLVHSFKKCLGPLGASVIKCLTLDFGLGHDLGVVGLSPVSGFTLSMESA